MATVAAFAVGADEFPLGTVFRDLPDVTVELERMVPTGNAVVPYFWVRGGGEADVVRRFRGRPGARDVQLVDSLDGGSLFRCTWEPERGGLLRAFEETDVTLLSGVGTGDRWTFELRGDDREAVARFQRYCLDHDVGVNLLTLHELPAGEHRPDYDLTPPQREALLLAYERGYFDTPRRTTLEEVASELEITRQSLAARLRRGHRNLIARTIGGEEDDLKRTT